MKTGNLNGQGLAELQNYKIQNLASAPTTNLSKGRFYFNTTDNTLYVYDGTQWLDALTQGTTYLEGEGIDITSNTISLDLATGANAGNVTLTTTNGLAANAPTASTSTAGLIEIATDTEASTGTSETLAVNPKQLATKIDLTDLSIDSGSTDYLGYDNTTGKISAKVDTTVTGSSSKLITSGAVDTAIKNAITNVYKAQGTVAFASLPTLSSSIEGYVYNVSDAFTTTSDFVEGSGKSYPAGTNVVCINTSGTTYKWDVLPGYIDTSSFLTASSTNTLTNKTIDADDNTISDLTTSNFKSGTIVTSIGTTGSDTAIPTEKSVRSAISALHYYEGCPALTASGGVCTWTVTHNLGTIMPSSVSVYSSLNGEQILCDITGVNQNVLKISILSASDIPAEVYYVSIQR